MNWATFHKTRQPAKWLKGALLASVLACTVGCNSFDEPLEPVQCLSHLDTYTSFYWDTAFSNLDYLPEDLRSARSQFYFAVQDYHLKSYIEALRKLHSAEESFEPSKDSSLMGSILTLKARIYNLYGLSTQAKTRMAEAQSWSHSHPVLWQEATLDLAAFALDENNFTEAKRWCDTLERSADFMNTEVREAHLHAIRGVVLKYFNRNSSRADSLIDYAFIEAKRLSEDHQKSRIYTSLLKAKPIEAHQVEQIRKFAKTSFFPNLLIPSIYLLQEFAPTTDSLSVLQAQQTASYRNAYRDQRLKFRNLMEFEYELEEWHEEKLIAQGVKQSQWFVLLISTLAITLMLTYIYFLATARTLRANRKMRVATAALDSYKNRVRPHFLFNQLNNVYGFLIQSQWDEAKNYVNVLSAYLWKMLTDTDRESWSLQEEINQLERYAELQQMSSSIYFIANAL